MVHILNKAEFIYETGIARKNAILLGDIVEDTTMLRTDQHENILTIGYLNEKDVKNQE